MKGVFLLIMISGISLVLHSQQGASREQPASPSATVNVFRVSLSVSPFTELLLHNGIVYTDDGVTAKSPAELQRLYMRHGANEVYARIATTRTYSVGFGDHSLERGLERARMARDLNLPFNPELGLFNIYGDAGCQPPPDFHEYPQLKLPGPWTSLTLDQMLPILQNYGAIVARMIVDTGVKVRIWDLGNEVEFGTAGVAVSGFPGACDDTAGGPKWYRSPDAVDPAIGKMSVPGLLMLPEPERIAWLQAHLWPHNARMFAAVAAGIRSVDPRARFSTHVSGITAIFPAQAVAFYEAMKQGGFFPDELGFSFYPSADLPSFLPAPHDQLQAFEGTLARVHDKLGRPVFIAEFGYPAEKLTVGPFATWNHALEDTRSRRKGRPTCCGIWSLGARSGVSGIRPWAPDVVAPHWLPFALFGPKNGTVAPRPSLDAIAEGLRSPKP